MLFQRSWKEFVQWHLETYGAMDRTGKSKSTTEFSRCNFTDLFVYLHSIKVRSPNDCGIEVNYFDGMSVKEFDVEIRGFLLLARLPNSVAATIFNLTVHRGQKRATWSLPHVNTLLHQTDFAVERNHRTQGTVTHYTDYVKEVKVTVVKSLLAKPQQFNKCLLHFRDANFQDEESVTGTYAGS